MNTLLAMLWLLANIIAIVELIRMIIESVKHGRTEKQANLVKKFFIAFAASVVCIIVAASIMPRSSPKPAATDAPVATISAEPSAIAETPTPMIEATPTPSATSEPTPSATPSAIPSSTPVSINSATPAPTVEATASVAEEPNAQADVREYVLNTNSHKFHKPSCSSVNTMDASNRKDVTTTRDDLIAQGYEPCKRCNP